MQNNFWGKKKEKAILKIGENGRDGVVVSVRNIRRRGEEKRHEFPEKGRKHP